MKNLKLTIKLKENSNVSFSSIKAMTPVGEFLLENGKNVTILLVEGEHSFCFLREDLNKGKIITVDLNQDMCIEVDDNNWKDKENLIYPIKKISFPEPRKNKKSQKTKNILKNIWNNNIITITLSAVLLISFLFIFSGEILMFIIISEVIANGYIIALFKDKGSTLGKAIFIATIASFVFGLLLGLICGIELYPDNGACGICGGDGIFGSKICQYCGGWGVKD